MIRIKHNIKTIEILSEGFDKKSLRPDLKDYKIVDLTKPISQKNIKNKRSEKAEEKKSDAQAQEVSKPESIDKKTLVIEEEKEVKNKKYSLEQLEEICS